MSIYLCINDDPMTEVTAKFTLRVGSRASVVKKHVFEEFHWLFGLCGGYNNGWGCSKFVTRQDVLDPNKGLLKRPASS
jgi:hypothetical protein